MLRICNGRRGMSEQIDKPRRNTDRHGFGRGSRKGRTWRWATGREALLRGGVRKRGGVDVMKSPGGGASDVRSGISEGGGESGDCAGSLRAEGAEGRCRTDSDD